MSYKAQGPLQKKDWGSPRKGVWTQTHSWVPSSTQSSYVYLTRYTQGKAPQYLFREKKLKTHHSLRIYWLIGEDFLNGGATGKVTVFLWTNPHEPVRALMTLIRSPTNIQRHKSRAGLGEKRKRIIKWGTRELTATEHLEYSISYKYFSLDESGCPYFCNEFE